MKEDAIVTEIFEILKHQLDANNFDEESLSDRPNSSSKLNSVQIIYNAKTISIDEVEKLKNLALLRESALLDLRKNNINKGSYGLEEINKILINSKLSREAFLINSTYQSAAEGFARLKQLKFSESLSLMYSALEAHKELHLKFGHRFEARRIHLSGNIIKILFSNNQKVEGFKMLSDLIKYLISNDESWPLKFCEIEKPDTIPVHIKFFLINQFIKSIGSLITQNPTEEILVILNKLINDLEQNIKLEFSIVVSWLKAVRELHKNNKIDILNSMLDFFKSYNGLIPDGNNYLILALNKYI